MSQIRIHHFHSFSVHRWYHWVILFVLLLLLLMVFPRAAGSQEWEVFTTENSPLVSNTINAFAFDWLGRTWIATDGGLMRYDDGDWTAYTHDTSDLPSDNVHDITIDHSNNVWAATDSGVVVISGDDWTVYTKENTSSGLKNNWTTSILIDDAGTAWIGTWGSGICTFDGSLWQWHIPDYVPELQGYTIESLHLAANGVVWIATRYGSVTSFNGASWAHYGIPIPDQDPDALHIKHLTSNQHGYIYAVTSWGVWNYSGGWCEELIDVDYEPLTGITVTLLNTTHDAVGSVFGLAVREVGDWELYTTENSPLPANGITELATGPDGRLWVGTSGGIAVISGLGTTVEDETAREPQAFVTAGPVYPNPFNSATVIPFALLEPAPVTVALYTVIGQHVRTLASGVYVPGQYTIVWDGTDESGTLAPAGVYLYRIATPVHTATGRMVLMK